MYARATSPPMLCATMSTREAPVAREPARKPEEVRGVLRIAVQQDDRRVRIARLEPRHAPAAERERRRQTQERGRRALYGEGPGARRPRGALLLVRRARGRMAPAVACRPRVGAQVEERARRGHAEPEQQADARERRHRREDSRYGPACQGPNLAFRA